MEYSIIKATPEEESTIEEYVHDHFTPDMPLMHAFGAGEGDVLPRPSVAVAFTLKAVDGQGNIIGVAINKVNPTVDPNVETTPSLKQMLDLMAFAERGADIKSMPKDTVELRVLSVRKEWRGRGVARRLVEESEREARALGHPAIRICCASEFTAKIARSLGWREVYRLAHSEYSALSGKEVSLKPTPPHDHLYYFYTDL